MKIVYIFDNLNRIRNTKFVRAISIGAKKQGFYVRVIIKMEHIEDTLNDGDVLVIWNRHFLVQDMLAKKFEASGNKVLVFERAYLNIQSEEEWFALGIGLHNTMSARPTEKYSPERFNRMGVTIHPWKYRDNNNILVASQSKRYDAGGFGYENYAHPQGWDTYICEYIRKKIPTANIIFRQNPKTIRTNGRTVGMSKAINLVSKAEETIENDLDKYDISMVVAYTSGAITDSLIHGVPVYIDKHAQDHIFEGACSRNITSRLYSTNRQAICEKIAWCQYSENELKNTLTY